MNFVQGHKSGMDDAALAVASQHIAQQSCGAVACALMSAHKAAQCCTESVERALTSAHKAAIMMAAQCIAEAARAVASQHLAQQSPREISPQFEFRYL